MIFRDVPVLGIKSADITAAKVYEGRRDARAPGLRYRTVRRMW
jgi:hypothetical protein